MPVGQMRPLIMAQPLPKKFECKILHSKRFEINLI